MSGARKEFDVSALPEWTRNMIPVDMDGAAKLLGVSRRSLVDVVRQYRHYEPRGARKVFYPEHIEQLREALKCQGSKSSGAKASPTPLEPSTEGAYERALALVMQSKQMAKPKTRRGQR